MSAGTRVTTVRINPAIRMACDKYIEERNKRPLCEPYTFSDLISVALIDFLDHVRRGRKKKKDALVQMDINDYIDAASNAVIVTAPITPEESL